LAERIQLAHGSGGKLTADLIREVFYPSLGGVEKFANDSAVINLPACRIALTIDSFVINPIFFPGGNIGKLAFCGTVNDLAAAGAIPIALSASFILEEGLDISKLRLIVKSMGEISQKTGITVVAGDTKVVDKGSVDKLFITTAGIGIIPGGINYHPQNIQPGDHIIVSGTIGDHGYCLTALRAGIEIKSSIKSDCQPLHELVAHLKPLGCAVHAARDATRGGVGMVLNEWSRQSGRGIVVYEKDLPIKDQVKGGCAMLGLEPIYLANEGKMVFAVDQRKSAEALSLIKTHKMGRNAAVIGEVVDTKAQVVMETEWGTKRLLTAPHGEILPRVC